MDNQTRYNVLFLCPGNAARSILAEALTNRLGRGRIQAYSAGSCPKGFVHPLVLDFLQSAKLPTDGLRSKSWDEFAAPDAPSMDLVISVCDRNTEQCPCWPGQPITAQWNIQDPISDSGSEAQLCKSIKAIAHQLQQRISFLVALSGDSLERLALETRQQRVATPVTDARVTGNFMMTQ